MRNIPLQRDVFLYAKALTMINIKIGEQLE